MTGGIVLCGGRSSRMGRPKAWLPFGEQTMLQRAVGVLQGVVNPIVIVAAPDQDVPPLPDAVEIVRDEEEGLGPLAGIAAGLSALHGRADAAYATSCDVPLLKVGFVRRIVELLGTHELAVPRDDRFHHPLAAVYRTSLARRCHDLLAAGQRRPLHLIDASDAIQIDVERLRDVDPDLDSLRNANTPEEYAALLRRAGYDDDISQLT